MAVAAAGEVRAGLTAAGASPSSAVQIVAEAGTARARAWSTALAELDATVASEAIASPAVLLVRLARGTTRGRAAA